MITRFAPSPTGPLHLGHAFSAITSHDMARAAGGQFLLRIEDIDPQRSRPAWTAALIDDLTWLGLSWDAPPLHQSGRMSVYQQVLDRLWDRGVLYPCTCTRRDLAQALTAPQEGVTLTDGPDGPVYPGTCRARANRTGPRPTGQHLRLDMAAATTACDPVVLDAEKGVWGLWFSETGPVRPGMVYVDREDLIHNVGDILLARRDFATSYHLSVVLDDAAQGITHVTRGADLFDATRIHVLLQTLLRLPTPVYHHHRLIRDHQGRRLAKRDDARSLGLFRAAGATPQDIRRMVGLDASAFTTSASGVPASRPAVSP